MALRSWSKEKVRDLLRAVLDGSKNTAHMLAESDDQDEEVPLSQEELSAMSKEDIILASTNRERQPFKNKFKVRAPQRDAAPRDAKNKTCPNCNEKGHEKEGVYEA